LRKYEIMLILPADADDEVIGGITERISQVLSPAGGSVGKVDRWGKRRLTYPIHRQSEGFYLVVECQADPSTIKELDRVLSLADQVIRFKVSVRPDEKVRVASG
jgi:small subunit ribosomal protein S6